MATAEVHENAPVKGRTRHETLIFNPTSVSEEKGEDGIVTRTVVYSGPELEKIAVGQEPPQPKEPVGGEDATRPKADPLNKPPEIEDMLKHLEEEVTGLVVDVMKRDLSTNGIIKNLSAFIGYLESNVLPVIGYVALNMVHAGRIIEDETKEMPILAFKVVRIDEETTSFLLETKQVVDRLSGYLPRNHRKENFVMSCMPPFPVTAPGVYSTTVMSHVVLEALVKHLMYSTTLMIACLPRKFGLECHNYKKIIKPWFRNANDYLRRLVSLAKYLTNPAVQKIKTMQYKLKEGEETLIAFDEMRHTEKEQRRADVVMHTIEVMQKTNELRDLYVHRLRDRLKNVPLPKGVDEKDLPRQYYKEEIDTFEREVSKYATTKAMETRDITLGMQLKGILPKEYYDKIMALGEYPEDSDILVCELPTGLPVDVDQFCIVQRLIDEELTDDELDFLRNYDAPDSADEGEDEPDMLLGESARGPESIQLNSTDKFCIKQVRNLLVEAAGKNHYEDVLYILDQMILGSL